MTFVCRLCTCKTLFQEIANLVDQVWKASSVLVFFVVRFFIKASLVQNDLARRRSGGKWTQECSQTGDGFLTQAIINVHLHRQMSCNE